MYQPAHVDSFIRLLICHLGNVLSQGEQLLENRSSVIRMDLLQYAIEQGEDQTTLQQAIDQQHDSETLFALQLSQSREWVDRLGQLDPVVERDTDEFLAATFSIEKLLRDRQASKDGYSLENIMTRSQSNCTLRGDLFDHIDIEAMMLAIFELLGRLEDQYDLMEELLDLQQVVNGVPFGLKYPGSQSAKIIPLFGASKKRVSQDNDCS